MLFDREEIKYVCDGEVIVKVKLRTTEAIAKHLVQAIEDYMVHQWEMGQNELDSFDLCDLEEELGELEKISDALKGWFK